MTPMRTHRTRAAESRRRRARQPKSPDNSRLLAMAILGGLGVLFAVLNLDEVEVNWIFGTARDAADPRDRPLPAAGLRAGGPADPPPRPPSGLAALSSDPFTGSTSTRTPGAWRAAASANFSAGVRSRWPCVRCSPIGSSVPQWIGTAIAGCRSASASAACSGSMCPGPSDGPQPQIGTSASVERPDPGHPREDLGVAGEVDPLDHEPERLPGRPRRQATPVVDGLDRVHRRAPDAAATRRPSAPRPRAAARAPSATRRAGR